jgi:hypothetical protein
MMEAETQLEAGTLLDLQGDTVASGAVLQISAGTFGEKDPEKGYKRSLAFIVEDSSDPETQQGPPRRTFDDACKCSKSGIYVESERPPLQCIVVGTMRSARIPLGGI